ncbi:MAG: site-specific integrase [Oscillospiraceae bacterium]|nr:site-specific integrase [Oscillospiraceae bacterium]
MKICDIRPQHLNKLYQELSQEGIRNNTKAVMREEIDLKALIKSFGHSNAERFVKENGMSLTTYRAMMHHEPVRLKTAQKMADALSIDMKKLFEIQEDMRPLSPKTVLEHHRLIHLILRQAEKELLIPFNPADRATPPKATRAKVQYFEKEQVAAILDAADQEPLKWKTVIHLLIATGGRRSEVLGLTWEHVDFVFNRVQIIQTVGYEKGYGTFVDKTKNETSERWIKLPPETMELLKEYRDTYYESLKEAAGNSWEGEGFLFVQDSGKHLGKVMHPDSITGYCNRFSDKYNLPHINPHAFRHTQASLLLFAGLDIITVSRHLGHAKPSTTTDLYAHVLQEAESRVADAMGSILFSTRKQLPKDDSAPKSQSESAAG